MAFFHSGGLENLLSETSCVENWFQGTMVKYTVDAMIDQSESSIPESLVINMGNVFFFFFFCIKIVLVLFNMIIRQSGLLYFQLLQAFKMLFSWALAARSIKVRFYYNVM